MTDTSRIPATVASLALPHLQATLSGYDMGLFTGHLNRRSQRLFRNDRTWTLLIQSTKQITEFSHIMTRYATAVTLPKLFIMGPFV